MIVKNICCAICLCFCALLAMADGECNLVQQGDGTYTISCTGDGIVTRFVDVTNKVFVIENCEQLKEELKLAADDVISDAEDILSYISENDGNLSERYRTILFNLYDSEWGAGAYYTPPVGLPPFDDLWALNPDNPELELDSTLRSYIEETFNSSISVLRNVHYNIEQKIIGSEEPAPNGVGVKGLRNRINNIECGSCSEGGGGDGSGNCCDVDLSEIVDRMNIQIDQLHFMSNRFVRITSDVQKILKSWDVPAALGRYDPSLGSYYDFLTNNYLKASRGETISESEGGGATNWFGRIETLLASLVFGDKNVNTNVLDTADLETQGQLMGQTVSNSLDSVSTQLEDFTKTSEGVVELIKGFGQSFRIASMPPSTVKLFSVWDWNTNRTDDVFFVVETEAQGWDVFRAITTMVWSFIGLFLAYKFLVWSINKIVFLVTFCIDLFGDLVKGG